jgi:rhodanese-related sulfurtransferase
MRYREEVTVPTSVFRNAELRRLVQEEGAQLVEVLPREEYEEEHLPGAVNIPLKELDRDTTPQLRRDAPVIVYCHDYYQKDMSPRAAWRLEGLGFARVYDYMPGKAAWFADGLPKEAKLASVPVIGDAARQDLPTCAPAEKIGVVRQRVRKASWNRCVVVEN